MPTPAAARVAFRAEFVDFADDPRRAPSALRHLSDGLLVVHDGRVESCEPAGRGLAALPPGTPVTDLRGCLVVPGFVDAHVHYAQTDVIASHGRALLDWLEQYTFPEEARFRDAVHARATAEFFLDQLLRNGTTTAAVWATSHPASVDAFFEAARGRGLRMLCGRVMMDRHCPDALRDTAQGGRDDCAALIERWHGRERLAYAVTPRFAPTSTDEQLHVAAQLLDAYPGVRLQTHVAENVAEIRWVGELYPSSRSYLDVYDRFGLVRPGALFAHCIHLDDDDWARLAGAGAAAVHCPTSNTFLGSGLFDCARARHAGARVALATDVGGGTSFGMLQTMHEAYKVARMAGRDFDALDAFYLATLGGARALGLDAQIGSFAPGREADFVVIDPRATPLLERRIARAGSLEERLFALLTLGDDRAIARTYVLGEPARRSA